MKVNAQIRARFYRTHIRIQESRNKETEYETTNERKGNEADRENLCKASRKVLRVTFLPNPRTVRPSDERETFLPILAVRLADHPTLLY